MKIGEAFVTIVDKDGELVLCEEGWAYEYSDRPANRKEAARIRDREDTARSRFAPHRVVRVRLVEVKEGEE